jgi:hypothetical protein
LQHSLLPLERIVEVYPQADFFKANKQITPA